MCKLTDWPGVQRVDERRWTQAVDSSLSSIRCVMVTLSTEVLVDRSSVKWKTPPGSVRVLGGHGLGRASTAGSTSVTVTVSSSVSVAVLFSLSATVTEAVLA